MAQLHQHHGAEKVVRAKRLGIGCDMNVTPLIDVLLVLLVIFMAALPMTQKGLDVNLPQAVTRPSGPTPPPDARIVVEIGADRRIAINQQPVTLDALARRLRTIYEQRKDKTMYIIGAAMLPYGAIVDIIDTAKEAGVDSVGIVTEGMRRAAGA